MDSAAADPVIFIVDDDESVRLAISNILRSVGLATQTFRSAEEFLRAPPVDAPSCLVLDVRLPGMSGLFFQQQMQERQMKTPIVMISGHGDIPMSVRAFKAGALDFLLKPFRDQDLLDSVSQAIEADRARRRQDSAAAHLLKRCKTLTPRESQILELVCKGLMNKQIAAKVGLSEITVKIYRGQAMKKMGAQSLPEWVRMSEVLKVHTGQSELTSREVAHGGFSARSTLSS